MGVPGRLADLCRFLMAEEEEEEVEDSDDDVPVELKELSGSSDLETERDLDPLYLL